MSKSIGKWIDFKKRIIAFKIWSNGWNQWNLGKDTTKLNQYIKLKKLIKKKYHLHMTYICYILLLFIRLQRIL